MAARRPLALLHSYLLLRPLTTLGEHEVQALRRWPRAQDALLTCPVPVLGPAGTASGRVHAGLRAVLFALPDSC